MQKRIQILRNNPEIKELINLEEATGALTSTMVLVKQMVKIEVRKQLHKLNLTKTQLCRKDQIESIINLTTGELKW